MENEEKIVVGWSGATIIHERILCQKIEGAKKQKNLRKLRKVKTMPSAYIKSKMKKYMQDEEIIQELQALVDDGSFHTTPGYSIDTAAYPDSSVPFIESHLSYLHKHPQVDPKHYLSNLRLMLKVR